MGIILRKLSLAPFRGFCAMTKVFNLKGLSHEIRWALSDIDIVITVFIKAL